MLIDRITSARLAGEAGLRDIVLRDGRVASIAPAGSASPAEQVLDAGGRVVAPAFVDAHVHLDKAYLLAAAEAAGPVEPRLDSAIAAVDGLRKAIALEEVRAHAAHAVATLAGHGTVAARVHVEVEPRAGLELLDLHLELAAEVEARIELQLVAFPQLGLELPGAADLLDAAMDAGATVVGGCPYVDDDPVAHLDAVFGLADRLGAPVDLHLDFTDDPSRSHLDLVIERTRALGMAGAVTVGHVTALASLAPDEQTSVFARLAEAGIALVALPATDLYLGGHGEPGTRSLAPIERAAAAGVTVAIATNNLSNPFAPFGNGSLVQAAWLTGITRRMGDAPGRRLLLDAITVHPATILGRDPHGPEVGAVADLVVLDAPDPEMAITQAAAVVATVHRGRTPPDPQAGSGR
jgi:cytosine deaminase